MDRVWRTSSGLLLMVAMLSGSADAQISLDPNARVRIPDDRPSLCTGSPPTCTCPRAQATCVNRRWLCVNPPEVCNGLDDNCDGQIDEGGEAICSDGLSCTNDVCLSGSCTHTPIQRRCQDTVACTTDRCEPNTPGHDSRGCVVALDHSMCNDKCDCNGLEQCMPGAGSDAKGCVPGVPVCERDSNLCTGTVCCENGPQRCALQVGAGASTRVLHDCHRLTLSFLERVISGTGNAVWCSRESPLPGGSCDDGNPCTTDTCDPVLRCVHTPVTDHTHVISSKEQGCIQTVCEGGHPVDLQVNQFNWEALNVSKPRCGDDADKNTCRRKDCVALPGRTDNVCMPLYLVPGSHGAPCDDGVQCNGVELCNVDYSGHPYTNPDGTTPLPGCSRHHINPCDDRNSCTTDTCTEPVDPRIGVRQCTNVVDSSLPGCRLN